MSATDNDRRHSSKKGETKAAEPAQMPRISIRIPHHLLARLDQEAEQRGEEISATARRRLALGITRDDTDGRLEVMDRKLDALLSSTPGGSSGGVTAAVEALSSAALEMEGRLAEVARGQKVTFQEIERLKNAFNQVAQILNEMRDAIG